MLACIGIVIAAIALASLLLWARDWYDGMWHWGGVG